MNTKGIKFLAVLTVLAMAFASVAFISDAQGNDAVDTVDVTDLLKEYADLKTIDEATQDEFYYYEDASVKVKAIPDNSTIYINNGATVEFKFKTDVTDLTVITVSGDRAGKTPYEGTSITFSPEDGSTFEYTAGTVNISGELKASASFYYSAVFDGAEFGEKTKVAAGETITIKSALTTTTPADLAAISADAGVKFAYGSITFSTNGTDYFAVYTAPGDSFGRVNLDDTSVYVKKGTGTVYHSSSSATLASIAGAEIFAAATTVAVEETTYDQVTLDLNSLNKAKGSIALAGYVALKASSGAITVGEDVTMTVNKNAVVDAASQVQNNGKIVLKNSTGITLNSGTENTILNNTKGIVAAENKDLWSGNTIKGIVSTSAGFVDTTSISEVVTSPTGSVKNWAVEVGQVIILGGDLTIVESFTINGILTIPAGVTLTISDTAIMTVSGIYAKVENHGTINIQVPKALVGQQTGTELGLQVTGNGSVDNQNIIATISAKPTGDVAYYAIQTDSDKFVNNGTLTISQYDKVKFEALENNGAITINGKVEAGTEDENSDIINSGIITFQNKATLGSSFVISDAAVDATAIISALQIPAGKTLTIDNAGIEDTGSYSAEESSIVFSATSTNNPTFATYSISRATVIGATQKVLTTTYTALDLSGSISVSYKDEAGKAVKSPGDVAGMTLSGRVIISDALTIPKYLDTTVSEGSTVTVSDTWTYSVDAEELTVGDGAKIDVTGKIVQNNGNNITAIHTGVAYQAGDSVYVITNFGDALSALTETYNSLTLYGTNKVSGPIEIPAAVDISGDGNITLTSGSMEVNAAATISSMIYVTSGTLHTLDVASLGDVDADVLIQEDGSDEATYMDLATAVNAVNGTVTLWADRADATVTAVVVYSDLTVPKSVTINATEMPLQVEGCTLTVEGRIIVDGSFEVRDSHVALGALVLEGGFFQYASNALGGDEWWFPAGILYTMVDSEENAFDVVTSLDNIATAISEDEDGTITVTGNTKVGDLSVIGTEEKPVTLVFTDDVDAGTITIDNAEIQLADGSEVTATFANTSGSIVIRDAMVNKVVISDEDDLKIVGTVDDISDGASESEQAYYIAFYGDVTAEAFTAAMNELGYESDDEMPTFIVNGTLTASGKSITIGYGIIIYGALIADNQSKITIEGDVQVVGSLIAMEKTTAAAGSIVIDANDNIDQDGNLYVGATKAQLFNSKAQYNTASAAVVSGDVSFAGFVIVTADAIIADDIVEDFYSMEIYIEDELFVTVISEVGKVELNALALPVTEAVVDKIYDQDGDEIEMADGLHLDPEYNTLYTTTDGQTITAFNFTDVSEIYITVNHGVYDLQIKTDDGVKSVAVNGMVMVYGTVEGMNVFSLNDLSAGTYTVTYTLKSGYEGTPVITTSMGTIIQGYDIMLSGDYDEPIVYQLTGTQKEVAPEPVEPEKESEWNITTILLVILVVLIAIMAVIVALRLNRN